MGQYHQPYNVTKKQTFNASQMISGHKLMEQIGFEKSIADAVYLLLSNSNGRGGGDAKPHPLIGTWAGDVIVVQGDYAEPGDPGFIANTDNYVDISVSVIDMLDAAGYC